MSLIKYIGRLRQMHDLIRRGSTGDSVEFAEKIGLNRAMLLRNLGEMKELGARIKYSKLRRTYYYEEEFYFYIGGKRDRDLDDISGMSRRRH